MKVQDILLETTQSALDHNWERKAKNRKRGITVKKKAAPVSEGVRLGVDKEAELKKKLEKMAAHDIFKWAHNRYDRKKLFLRPKDDKDTMISKVLRAERASQR
jgi:hypothetical protein